MSVQVLILHLESSLHFVAGDVRQALKDVTAEHSLDVTQLQELKAETRDAAWSSLAQQAGTGLSAQSLAATCTEKLRERCAWRLDLLPVSSMLSLRWHQTTTNTLQVHECCCGSPEQAALQGAFQEAAAAFHIRAPECLVINSSPPGGQAAVQAGMQAVTLGKASTATEGVSTIASLLDLDLGHYGLPDFEDRLEGSVLLQPPWTLQGRVVKGFGRGSKDLGIPTANVDAASLQATLAETVTGIYCGWARIGTDDVCHQMVMSIGYNPFYNNTQKTAEAWLLHTFQHDFYDAELRLLIAAYIRPEANFTTVEALIQQIHGDADVTKRLLAHSSMQPLQQHTFLWPDR